MENRMIFENDIKIDRPIVIEGLPGVGNVGKIAADYMKEKLNAKRLAKIYSKYFLPKVTIDDNCIVSLACNELWYIENDKGSDIMLLLGDHQALTPFGHYDLADYFINYLKENNITKLYTVGGYGVGKIVREPRVLGAVSSAHLKPELEAAGVTFMKDEELSTIMGASGVLMGIGTMKGLDSVCLMGETSGYFLDHKSAMAVLKVLSKLMGFEIDFKELQEKSKELEKLTEKVKEFEMDKNKDLVYFG